MYLVMLLMAGGLNLTGCTKGSNPICEGAKLIAAPVAATFAELGECEGIAEIEAWLSGLACSDEIKANGPIGNLICPKIVDTVINTAAAKLIKPEFKCKLTSLKENARPMLIKACTGAVPLGT